MSELTGSNHRCRAQFKCAQTVFVHKDCAHFCWKWTQLSVLRLLLLLLLQWCDNIGFLTWCIKSHCICSFFLGFKNWTVKFPIVSFVIIIWIAIVIGFVLVSRIVWCTLLHCFYVIMIVTIIRLFDVLCNYDCYYNTIVWCNDDCYCS